VTAECEVGAKTSEVTLTKQHILFYEEYIRGEVANVMHPTINCSLIELGMVKNIEINRGVVIITMAIPFTEVPVSIKDYLIEMVRKYIEEIEKPVEIETVVMTKG